MNLQHNELKLLVASHAQGLMQGINNNTLNADGVHSTVQRMLEFSTLLRIEEAKVIAAAPNPDETKSDMPQPMPEKVNGNKPVQRGPR